MHAHPVDSQCSVAQWQTCRSPRITRAPFLLMPVGSRCGGGYDALPIKVPEHMTITARRTTVAAYILIRHPHQRFRYLDAFRCPKTLILVLVVSRTTKVTPPFAPDPLQVFRHYYGESAPILSICAENRFSRSPKWPGSGSCCLNNGCSAIGRQVSSALLGARLCKPLLTPAKISSLHQSVHLRSTT